MNFRSYMKDNGLSDAQMAETLGVSVGTVRKWRFGERMPEPQMVERIVEATNGAVTVQDLHEARLAFLKSDMITIEAAQ